MGKFRLAVFNTQPPQLYFGGVEKRIIETTRRLTEQASITVYSGTKAGFKEPLSLNDVTFIPCHSTDKLFPLDNWFFNRSLSKKAGILDADIYEAHNVSGYGFPRVLEKRNLKKPFIHVIHGPLLDEYEQALSSGHQSFRNRAANLFMRYLARLEEETAKKATLLIAVSQYSKAKILADYHVDETKIRVVPNGVDPQKFKPEHDASAAKRQFGLSDEPHVLFVGSLIPRKGLPFLTKAAEKIIKERAETKFLIVGEGPMKNSFIASLAAAHISRNFKFLGNVKEDALAALYNSADLLVLPSIQEGQGIVLLEAEASGKPVVAFDVGGVNEAVRNEETGLLVEQGNTGLLANAVIRLLSDKGLRDDMGANARRFVLNNFTWEICAQRMLRVYEETLGT